MPNNPLIEAFKQTLMNMGQNERNLGQGVPPPPMYQRPEVNLDPIRIIQSLTGGGQPQAQAPQQPQMPASPMNIASPMENVGLAGQQGQQTPQGNGINWQMLMDIGIPALSAIIGTAAPGTLAGASGFSSGYTGAREKQREEEREYRLKNMGEDEVAIVDPDDPDSEPRIVKVPKGAKILKKGGNPLTVDDVSTIIQEVSIPKTKTGESLKTNKIRVRKINSGETGNIDSDEFDSSLYEKL